MAYLLSPSRVAAASDLEGPILVVAGEASGDQHAGALVQALRQESPRLTFFGMGDREMSAAGVELLHNARDLAVMGLAEVAGSFRHALGVLRSLRRSLETRRPRAVILVDFPDFNLRLARTARDLDIPVIYFISPQVWVWRPGRVHAMARNVDRVICILPFEVPFYRNHGVRAVYVGHPLVDQVGECHGRERVRAEWGLEPEEPVVALIPGSRKQEVQMMLGDMLGAAARLHSELGVRSAILPLAPTLDREDLERSASGLQALPMIKIVTDRFFDVLAAADVALVASGTSTLAAAMLDVPMVLGYRLHPLTYTLGRFITQVEHVGLVNLVAGERVVPERIQDDFSAENLFREAKRLLLEPEAALRQRRAFQKVRARLGPPGVMPRAAEAVVATLLGSRKPRP